MPPLPGFLQPEIDAIVKRGASLRLDEYHAAHDFAGRSREVLNKLCPIIECDDEVLVFLMRSLEQPAQRLKRARRKVTHRARHVIDYSQSDRSIFIGEVSDLLLDAVVKDFKIPLGQSG